MLFTDIEGSTRLAAALGSAWPGVLRDHHALVGAAIAAAGGWVERTEGDAFFATFSDPRAGARAAVGALRSLRAHPWPPAVGELRVRMGLHVGFVERAETGYVGLEVHRAARVAAAAHGGQLLLTAAARSLIGDAVASEPLGTHRLKDFPAPEALFCAVVDGRGAAAFPPPRTQTVRPTNLPGGRPALVGREEDLQRIRDALLDGSERIVTVTGRGGAGKTSLALVAAAGLLDEHPGGVWLARLAGVASPDGVLPALASAVGTERDVARPPADAIAGRLRDRGPVLLVLDNLEHLTAAAPAIEDLLDTLPNLRVLATSQAPLRLAAERCLPLDALDDEAALALIERVARRRGATGHTDREALLALVRLLDGLPLALELAAARLALLTPGQLLERLRESPDLLKDAHADRADRHRSLRATVDWTLGLLDAPARALFTRIGAFAGPVELDQLEAIAGADGLDVLEALTELLDVALVRRLESGDGRVRFTLPEALRQIASALLDAAPDGPDWRRRHARHQHDIAWRVRTPSMSAGADHRAALAANAEAAAAVGWARAAGDPLAAPLAAAHATLLADSGRVREALALLEPILAAPSGDALADGQAWIGQAWALLVSDRMEEGRAATDRASAMAADPWIQLNAHILRGFQHLFAGAGQEAVREFAQATSVARGLGPAAHAGALIFEGQSLVFAGELDQAAQALAEAERIGAPVDAKQLAHIDTVYGDLAIERDRPREALPHYVRSIEAAETRNDLLQVHFDLQAIANALARLGHDAEALEVHALAEAHGNEIGGPDAAVVDNLYGLDPIALAEQRAGAEAAAEYRARGHAVAAGRRVFRACQLARARAA
jgi:predicted ATPase/class 3 adenylate cyclase